MSTVYSSLSFSHALKYNRKCSTIIQIRRHTSTKASNERVMVPAMRSMTARTPFLVLYSAQYSYHYWERSSVWRTWLSSKMLAVQCCTVHSWSEEMTKGVKAVTSKARYHNVFCMSKYSVLHRRAHGENTQLSEVDGCFQIVLKKSEI